MKFQKFQVFSLVTHSFHQTNHQLFMIKVIIDCMKHTECHHPDTIGMFWVNRNCINHRGNTILLLKGPISAMNYCFCTNSHPFGPK